MDAPAPNQETASNSTESSPPASEAHGPTTTTGQSGEVTLPGQVTFERDSGGSDLLPPFLLWPAATLWLWVLPVAILLALNFQGYWLVEGNMDAPQKALAGWFGLAGAGNVLLGVASYFALSGLRRRSEGRTTHLPYWGLLMVVAEVGYLWLAMSQEGRLLPVSVRAWIYTSDRFMFNQFAFAMVPLFYGVLLLACGWRSENVKKGFLTGLGLAIGAPVLAYLGGQFVMRTMHFQAVVVASIFVLLGLAMFVGLIRVLAILLKSVRGTSTSGELWAIVMFGLGMPVGGLLLNRAIPFPVDFQSWEVYALTVANAAILAFSSWKKVRNPMLGYGLLCAAFPFTLYFFFVFLPYTPLSIVAVILFGLGFLVLTPTVLFGLHVSLLAQVLRGPLANRRRGSLALVGLGAFLLLPGIYTLRGLADKAALNAALDYVYEPSVKAGAADYPGSLLNLKRALHNHRAYKNGIYYPILSDYYSWLVFDNLVLPDGKLAQLETVFLGAAGSKKNLDLLRNRSGGLGFGSSVRARSRMPRARPMPRDVAIAGLDVRTLPAGDSATVVTLALTLQNTGSANAEYVKALTLPAGVYVNGLRLHMNGVPVPGRIFEKKTALWVYEMIRDSERRDPALLSYTAAGQLELRVFPIVSGTPTLVELDFLVPATTAQLTGLRKTSDPAAVLIALGERLGLQTASGAWGRVVAGRLPEAETSVANTATYLHVIVDRSSDNGFDGNLVTTLRALKMSFPAASHARITTANYAVADTVATLTPIDELIGRAASLGNTLPLRGGFGLDLALAHALRLHRDEDLDKAASKNAVPLRPIFVVVGRKALLKKEALPLAERWADVLPAFELFASDTEGLCNVVQATLPVTTTWLRSGGAVRPLGGARAVQFPGGNATGALEYWSPKESAWRPVSEIALHQEGSPWEQATRLEARERDYACSPGEVRDGYREIVAASKSSGILFPETSYIAVENAAQWRVLEGAEKTKLGQNAALEHVETPAPPAVWVGLGFCLWLWLRRWRGRCGPSRTPHVSDS